MVELSSTRVILISLLSLVTQNMTVLAPWLKTSTYQGGSSEALYNIGHIFAYWDTSDTSVLQYRVTLAFIIMASIFSTMAFLFQILEATGKLPMGSVIAMLINACQCLCDIIGFSIFASLLVEHFDSYTDAPYHPAGMTLLAIATFSSFLVVCEYIFRNCCGRCRSVSFSEPNTKALSMYGTGNPQQSFPY